MKSREYYRKKLWIIPLIVVLSGGCNHNDKLHVSYVNDYTVKSNAVLLNTVFGGISGIDYNTKEHILYLVTDDRSKYDFSRVYTAKIQLDSYGINGFSLERVVFLSDSKGSLYPHNYCDMESIRYLTKAKLWIIGSEGGEYGIPGIGIYNLNGQMIRQLALSDDCIKNLRPNKSFECLSVSTDEKNIIYGTESSLVCDGEEASIDKTAQVRIKKVNITSGEQSKLWNYTLEKVYKAAEVTPKWGGTGSDNGLTELLVLGETDFLTLERSGSHLGNSIFEFHCKVYHTTTLKKQKSKKNVYTTKKELLIDFSKIPNGNTNIEGMCFGPYIDGHKTLLFV